MSKITLEKLAGMMKNSFDDTNSRFGDLENKMNDGFDKVNDRFNKIDQRFDSLEHSVNRRFFESNDQLHGLQDKVARVETILRIG